MINSNIIEQYLSANKNLTLLNGKRPIIKDWVNKKVPHEKLFKHQGNIGWVLGSDDLVVDVDPKNGGEKGFKKLLKDLDIDLEPTVNTPSGGFHVYLEIPKEYQGKQFKKNLKEYQGIDFLSKGCQCVIAGSETNKGEYIWSDDIFGEFRQLPAPQRLINILSYKNDNVNSNNDNIVDDGLGDFTGLIGGDSASWSEVKVLEMLEKLDPSMTNDDWVKVGMALHDWEPVKGLELWEQWSLGGSNYKEGETAKRWKSFTLGGGVTLGTVSHMNKIAVFEEVEDIVDHYIEKIKTSDWKTIKFDLIPKIKNEKFSKEHREPIAKAIQDQFKEIKGVRLPIANVRNMVIPDIVVEGEVIGDDDNVVPSWCSNWVYVNSHAGFMNTKKLNLHKSESFNNINGKYIPITGNGAKPSATKYVADRGFVDDVDSIAYLPTYEGTICEIDDLIIFNSFNPKSVPIEAKEFTAEGLEAIELIKKHIKFICTTNEHAHIFTQWLAHQVQYKGRQVLWSPVIQSIQGVGKSFFGELLRICLGDRNVGTVSPTQVTNSFNGWATNVVVNVLEELRVKGHNRYDVINSLKPLITDRMIQINDKGVKQYMTYNTTNYMCFTNYKDSLPLSDDDRRWWVIFVPIQSLDDLKNYVGETAKTYFPKLFNAIRNYGAEVRKWLLEYDITKEFLDTKQAPMTEYKQIMIATEESSFEGLEEIKELIETGGKYFNKHVISSPDLFDALLFEHPNLEFKTTQKNIILKKLGYMSLPKRIKIDGKPRRCWAKKQIEPAEVRQIMLENYIDTDDL